MPNDLGSGSNVDLCVITKEGVEYKRNYEYLQVWAVLCNGVMGHGGRCRDSACVDGGVGVGGAPLLLRRKLVVRSGGSAEPRRGGRLHPQATACGQLLRYGDCCTPCPYPSRLGGQHASCTHRK